MSFNPHNMVFNSSRDLLAALLAALEKAMNGQLDPVIGRRLIRAARIFNAELDKKTAAHSSRISSKRMQRR